MSDKKIIQILKTIKNSPKLRLIHCWHGSDRTGVVVAIYRLIFQNWNKRQVIDELM
ncbi:tyrosine-protein phosphatase [Gilliamella apis]|uniref:tyrosine-protein phosphatase n=1 Tax=Gilliamella apis TaxID=1970738 RepID=UPI003AAEAF0D